MGILGIFTLLGISYLLSNNRQKINYRLIIWGLAIQLILVKIYLWQSSVMIYIMELRL